MTFLGDPTPRDSKMEQIDSLRKKNAVTRERLTSLGFTPNPIALLAARLEALVDTAWPDEESVDRMNFELMSERIADGLLRQMLDEATRRGAGGSWKEN